MWIPILLAAGGYGLKRMRRSRRRRARRHGIAIRRRAIGGGRPCRLWREAQPIAPAIRAEASVSARAVIDGLGPLNLHPHTQVEVYSRWAQLLTSDSSASASMIYAKHIGEQITSGCRLNSHGRDLDVLRSIRDLGLVAIAQFTNRNPLRV